MRWASASSVLMDPASAAGEACTVLRAALGEGPVDLVLAFFSPSHVAGAEALAKVLRERLEPGCFAAVSAHGTVSASREIESGPSLSVVAARLPGVTLSPFIVTNDTWTEHGEDPAAFRQLAPGAEDAELVLLFADPFSVGIENVLDGFRRHAPAVRVVGGLASAGVRPGTNVLFLNDWMSREGGIGLALSGALRADVVVSQGCRPIGPQLEVTRSEGNVLIELDGQPALERTEQVLMELAEGDRDLLRNGLYIGRPVHRTASGQGEYLIRNLLGADRDRGAMAVGDFMRAHEHIRLHVRDARSALEDLEMLLSPQVFDSKAQAALVFPCNGRGRGLFGDGDQDIRTLQSALGGEVPAAGMFCAGEIGPVGGRNFVHGHTASIAIIRPA